MSELLPACPTCGTAFRFPKKWVGVGTSTCEHCSPERVRERARADVLRLLEATAHAHVWWVWRDGMTALSNDHPRQELLFIVFGGSRPKLDEDLERMLAELGKARTWTLGAPEMVELEDEGRLGGVLKLYSALPPWRERLPKEIDRAHLDEVTFLVDRLARFSAEHGLELDFELDGESVGGIRHGHLDRSLAEGLLGEWRRTLGVGGA